MSEVDRWESVREAAGITPEKWAVMTREERRQAERALNRAPRNRMIERLGRNR